MGGNGPALVQFGDIELFLQREDVGSPATMTRLRNILSDSNKKIYIQIELASTIDFGKPFVTATYNLEGDGPLVLGCYEVIEEVKAAVQSGYTPNVEAVVREICATTTTPQRQAQLKAYSKRCIHLGIDNFVQAYMTLWLFSKLLDFSPLTSVR